MRLRLLCRDSNAIIASLTKTLQRQSSASCLPDVAMCGMRIEACTSQRTGERVSYHHGSMTTARAPDSHGDIRLTLAFIERQKIRKQIGKAIESLLNLGVRSQIFNDASVMPGKLF